MNDSNQICFKASQFFAVMLLLWLIGLGMGYTLCSTHHQQRRGPEHNAKP